MKLKNTFNLGKIIDEIRIAEGYKEIHLAEYLHDSQQTINRRKLGMRMWSLDSLIQLSGLLKFKISIEKGEMEIMHNKLDSNNNKESNERELKIVKDFGHFSIIEIYSNSEDGVYGNISSSMEDILSERAEALERDPESKILIGYCLLDNRTGYCPDSAMNWHDTIDSAENEYYNYFEVTEEFDLKEIRPVIVEYLEEHIEDSALGHIDAWRDRYWGKSLKDISFDLCVNYDISAEHEWIEDALEVELTGTEEKYVTARFIKEVLSLFRNGFSHLL